MASKNQEERLMKLLIIGNSGVGKSCLLLRYSEGGFTKAFYNTIGVDFKVKNTEIDGQKVKVQIWDTAGQDRFRTITSSYYKGAHGILVVYDITDRESFIAVKHWLQEIEKNATDTAEVILVGNKLDLAAQRKVTYDEGYDFGTSVSETAKANNLSYLETSALTDNNISLVFETICKKVLRNEKALESKPDPTRIVGSAAQPPKKQSRCC